MIKALCALALFLCMASVPPAIAQTPMANPEARATEASERLAASIDRLSYRPDLPAVASTLSFLASENRVAEARKQEAAVLQRQLDAAYRAGRTGEALRLAYQSISLLLGRDWSIDAFPASLAFDLAPVIDPALPFPIRVRGNWTEIAPAGASVALRLARFDDGQVVHDFGRHAISSTDMVASPLRLVLNLGGIAPGTYRLEGRIEVGGRVAGTIRAPVSLVAGLDRSRTEIEKALARIAGHEDAKATIRYPFSLATELFEGRREIRSFDFTAGIARSKALLAALQAGTDPVVRAKGDIHRAYYFAEADSIVPFRLHVPADWDGKERLPLVVFLHGANLDDDDSMERAGGLLPRIAEQRRVILLAPLGYRMNSMYGAPVPERFATWGSPIAGIDPRRAALSEKDVTNLVDLVSAEYDVDRSRVYLAGNSMGGMGTWHLAQKYPDRWAAVAPAAAGATDPDYDFGRLKQLPIMPVAGEHDFLRSMVEDTVGKAKAAGLKPNYMMVPGGDHGTGVEIAWPAIIDFFLKHRRPPAHGL